MGFSTGSIWGKKFPSINKERDRGGSLFGMELASAVLKRVLLLSMYNVHSFICYIKVALALQHKQGDGAGC